MSIDTATVAERDLLRPLRYLWRVPLLLVYAVLAILLAGLVLSWNRQRVMRHGREPFAHRLVRWWSTGLMRIFGLRAVRVGQPLADPVLFVANHTSWIDIEMLHSQRAACFVAKAEIAGWPLVGWLAASGGTIFHRRGSNHSLAAVMQVMVERLQRRAQGIPCAHLPGCARRRGAGAAGGAALCAWWQADRGCRLPRRREFRGQFPAPAGRAADGCRGAFPQRGAGQFRGAPAHGRTIARTHRRGAGRSRRMNLPRGKDFLPPRLLRSGHVQTMLSSSGVRRLLLPRAAKTVLQGAEPVVVDGGGGVRLTGAYTAQRIAPKSRGLAVLFHGWEGSVDSTYVLQTGSRLLADGWDIFRL